MRVLIIAPDYTSVQALDTKPEVHAIQHNFTTFLLYGMVSAKQTFETAQRDLFDIIHIAAHGDTHGIQLSDGIFGPDALVRMARAAKAKLVYFNSCNSARLGQMALDGGVPSVIMTSDEISDLDAWSIAVSFYNELFRNGGDMRAAYTVAKPDNGMLIWLSDGRYVEQSVQPVLDKIIAVQAMLEKLKEAQEAALEKQRMLMGLERKAQMDLLQRHILWWLVGVTLLLLLVSVAPDIIQSAHIFHWWGW